MFSFDFEIICPSQTKYFKKTKKTIVRRMLISKKIKNKKLLHCQNKVLENFLEAIKKKQT